MSVTAAAPKTAPTTPPADWPDWLVKDFNANTLNGRVGSTLVSESPRARVWHIRMEPGDRLPFHRHVLDYFWTVTTPGSARSHYADGRTVEMDYEVGDTQHFTFAKGEFMYHDLENIGDTVLSFVTVEHLESANPPLPVD